MAAQFMDLLYYEIKTEFSERTGMNIDGEAELPDPPSVVDSDLVRMSAVPISSTSDSVPGVHMHHLCSLLKPGQAELSLSSLGNTSSCLEFITF